jgi:hypothetical protein
MANPDGPWWIGLWDLERMRGRHRCAAPSLPGGMTRLSRQIGWDSDEWMEPRATAEKAGSLRSGKPREAMSGWDGWWGRWGRGLPMPPVQSGLPGSDGRGVAPEARWVLPVQWGQFARPVRTDGQAHPRRSGGERGDKRPPGNRRVRGGRRGAVRRGWW